MESIRGMPLAQQPDLWSKLQVQKDDEVSWRGVFSVTIGECFRPTPSLPPPQPPVSLLGSLTPADARSGRGRASQGSETGTG